MVVPNNVNVADIIYGYNEIWDENSSTYILMAIYKSRNVGKEK